MPQTDRQYLLGPLLKGVSRSFWLTLRILPAGMREPIGLAYLLARAADTIADTPLIPPSARLRYLLSLRQAVSQAGSPPDAALQSALLEMARDVAAQQTQSDEKVLLESLVPAVQILARMTPADRTAIQGIVQTLSEGMAFDLHTFPDEHAGRIVALREWSELDHYTWLVAGCVGEFWTQMTYAHLPGILRGEPGLIIRKGVAFGKALQLVNVLRDCAKDLRIGRCYLPASLLAEAGLTPEALLLPTASALARPVLLHLVSIAVAHFRDALDYTFALPRYAIRLRLACLWPIFIGLETLALLVENAEWLDPSKISKVNRHAIYRIVATSTIMVASDTLLRRRAERLFAQIGRSLDALPATDSTRY